MLSTANSDSDGERFIDRPVIQYLIVNQPIL